MNKIGSTTVYLSWVLEENGLCIERFHRGCFSIGRSFRRSLLLAKTLLTQWRGNLSRMWYYTMEGSNGEDDIDTEDGI